MSEPHQRYFDTYPNLLTRVFFLILNKKDHLRGLMPMNEAQVENHITASVTTPDPSKTVWAVWIPILCTVTGLLGGGVAWGVSQYISWQSRISDQQKAVADENNRLLHEYLPPVQAKLKLNRSTYTQLSDPRFSEPGYGIL